MRKAEFFYKKSNLNTSLLVFLISLIVTVLFTGLIIRNNLLASERAQDNEIHEISNWTTKNLNRIEALLLSVRGLFLASEEVTAVEFREFIDSIEISKNFPELSTISYVPQVQTDQISEFEKAVADSNSVEYLSNYSVSRIDSNSQYQYPITYMEPLSGREAALGLNMGHDVDRLSPLLKSIETKQLTLSKPIDFVTGFKGVLIFLPIVESDDEVVSEVLIASIRVEDFFAPLVSSSASPVYSFKILSNDGQAVYQQGVENTGRHKGEKIIAFDRNWQIMLYDESSHISRALSTISVLVFLLGLIASILFAWATYYLLSKKAVQFESARTDLVSLASHQLRTPLTSIRWNVNMLLDPRIGTLNNDQNKYLRVVSEHVAKMSSLIKTLLNVTRIDLHSLTNNPQKISINEFITQIIDQYQRTLVEKNIKINYNNTSDKSHLEVDPEYFSVIIDNLVSNAVKYSLPETLINIDVLPSPSERDFYLTISDSGIGIPKSDQVKIFDKMFRASNAKHRITDGTGLGLYAVKKIVEFYKGSISFESKENHGTTFRIKIPYDKMSTKV